MATSRRRTGATPAQTLIILGATGDLTGRLLLPGIGDLLAGPRGTELRIIGVGREDWTQAKWVKRVKDAFAAAGASGPRVERALAATSYQRADVTRADELDALVGKVSGPLAIFFALPPAITAQACRALSTIGLSRRTRLVLEKPFGTDAATATELNELLDALVPEDNTFRVDHFLGKSAVLNLLGLRFGNRLFEPVLRAEHVERIDIIFDENLALEGRAGYYDGAGALVDMIQSHLLQVMAVLTMEAPPTLSAADLRDRKSEILRATRIWGGDPVAASRRARYLAGSIGRRAVPSYASESGVDPSRKTETLAEIVVEVATWRWIGVPIVLRSGKALGAVRKEAVITFKEPPRFPDGFVGRPMPNQLRIGFSDPGFIDLAITVNGPGDPLQVDPAELTVDLGPGELKPYGEVLAGVLAGDPGLSVRGDAAVDGWRIVQPVLDAWRSGAVPLDSYRAGGSGPAKWRKPLG